VEIEIRWTNQAIDDLQNILQFLQQHSPSLALRLIDRVIEAEDLLVRFPQMGKSLAYLGYPDDYKLVIKPYVISYNLEGNVLCILRFLDGRQIY
jgi:addiction module RelE/StbE family toxin